VKVLVVAPHPDDETLCCGGIIMNFIEKGDKVKVVIVTDGRYGAPSEELRGTEELVRIRREEALRVFKILGVDDFEFLNFEDTKVSQKRKEVEEKLSRILHNYNPDIVFSPSPFDRHIDHSEIGKIMLRLFPNSYFYAVWGDQKVGEVVKFEIKNKKENKVRALEKYKSQIGGIKKDLPFEKLAGDYEVFYKISDNSV